MSSSSSESLLPPAVETINDLSEPAKKKLKVVRARVVHAMSLWRSFDQHHRHHEPPKQQHRDKRTKFKKQSRSASTVKGYLCCTCKSWVHARKFAKVNGLLPTSPSAKGWTPTKESLIPGKEHLTNDNLEEFFVQCWEDGSKPNVTQGRRYINHILTHHGQPPMNKMFRQKYASVLDVLAGLKREEKWRNHTSQGAKPLPLAYVKKILMAPVHDEAGNINLLHLRNKTLAACLILCGWHQKDAYELMDKCVINLEDHHDRDGSHRPKFMFNNIFHNKRDHWKVCNTVGCGCKGCHQPKNSNCPYNLLLWYSQEKEECDDKLRLRKTKLSRKERLKHFDERGHLTGRHFFRSITKAGYEHRNMGQHGIRGVLEFFRPILGLGDVKLTTDMARKTFCTLGVKYTGKLTAEMCRMTFCTLGERYTGNKHPGALQDPGPAAHGRHPPQDSRPVPDLCRQRVVARPGVGRVRGPALLAVGPGPLQAAAQRVCARRARAHPGDHQDGLREHHAHAEDHQLNSVDPERAEEHPLARRHRLSCGSAPQVCQPRFNQRVMFTHA